MSGWELTLLREGSIKLVGKIVRSSNAAFLAELGRADESGWAVYKPEAGERPLLDFGPGLYRREAAAYLLSEFLHWDVVPPTVIRQDAPLGVGSLQWFVSCDGREHYFTLQADAPQTHPALLKIAVFDVIANNADRKSGHVLHGHDGRVWGIDHGLCFSSDYKLRTVIWDFAGEPIPGALLEDIALLTADVPARIAELLTEAEVEALQGRARRLLRRKVLPVDRSGMRYPWPLV